MTVSLTILSGPAADGPRTIAARAGTTLLQAAQQAGVDVTATCGGRGRCTSCRVQFLAGTVPPPTIGDTLQLGDDLVREGFRLACQCLVEQPVTIRVAPPVVESAFQILGPGAGVRALGDVPIASGVDKRTIRVELPREERHQTSDLEQLASALGDGELELGAGVLRTLPEALRGAQGEVTVATFGRRVLAVERGDTAGLRFGLAVDVGTTTVVSTLVELGSGEQLGTVSSLNPQAVFGADLMSRLAFAQFDAGNLRKLHLRIIGLLNQHVAELERQTGVLPKWIYKVVVVGNTCMHHLVLGIDPSWVGLAPYAPVLRGATVLTARELALRVAPDAAVCFLPIVAGFVGADAVAVALATRLAEHDEIRMAVDIGTNGEVLLGSRARLWACSAPAGPAFEGAQIRHGMRAAAGAVDRVRVEDDIVVHTIADADALGICGSGLIDLVAGLLDTGVIDVTGLIRVEDRDRLPPRLRERVVLRDDERRVVVLRSGEAGAPRELVLTQDDVRQVQLAKGAIAGGAAMLLRVAGLEPGDLGELMVAGGFGNYVSVTSALRIGLVPPIDAARVRYVGNAAALGAQLALLSERERARADEVAARFEHVPLAGHPDFEDVFVGAMNFPAPP